MKEVKDILGNIASAPKKMFDYGNNNYFRPYTEENNRKSLERDFPKQRRDQILDQFDKCDLTTFDYLFNNYKTKKGYEPDGQTAGLKNTINNTVITGMRKEEKEREIAQHIKDYINNNLGKGFCRELLESGSQLKSTSDRLNAEERSNRPFWRIWGN